MVHLLITVVLSVTHIDWPQYIKIANLIDDYILTLLLIKKIDLFTYRN